MRAIILAAGRGSRMKGFTDSAPKCLVKLAGKTLLERQLGALRAAGIEEIAIVRGYRGELLNGFGTTLFDNPHWQVTNMVASLRCAQPWLASAECIVSYSDIFYGAQTVSRLAAASGNLVIAYDPEWRSLWDKRFEEPLSDAESFRRRDDGSLMDIGRRVTTYDEIEGQYMGLLRFNPASWQMATGLLDRLPAADAQKMDMTSMLSRLIGAGGRVDTVAAGGCWGEVDAASDLLLYEELRQSDPNFAALLV